MNNFKASKMVAQQIMNETDRGCTQPPQIDRDRIREHIQIRTGWDNAFINQCFKGYDVITTAIKQMEE